MTATPYLRLIWKEYRAIRLFWLCLAGIFMFLQWVLAFTFSDSRNASADSSREFFIAIVAPVLFALGSAGTAFAIEKEDGTFEFLRASPVKPQHIVASKMLVTSLATIAMFLLLYRAAFLFAGAQSPHDQPLRQLSGILAVAAIEAIAWGTLFSILSERPLVAICKAVVFGSTITHVLAWSLSQSPRHYLNLDAYTSAIPGRLVIAAIVLGIDVVLGLRWLSGAFEWTQIRRTKTDRQTKACWVGIGAQSLLFQAEASKIDRASSTGRLIWQYWRQVWRAYS